MAMEMLKHFMLVILCMVALPALVHAQSQSGFISIDCGIPANSSYTDKITGINYTSDATFVETGVNNSISPEYKTSTLERQFLNVRSFPEGKRNCYILKPARGGTKFLIRARFMYGNYDRQGKLPSFNLILGADVWESVELADASTIVTKEIIHVRQKNYIYVCLVNTGSGTPFISALELRTLKNSTYKTKSGSLLLMRRWDVGSATNQTIRYVDDIFDRIWSPYNISRPNWTPISSSRKVSSVNNNFEPPSTIMQTAVFPANGSDSLQFSWKPSNPEFKYYFYFHFAEIEENKASKTRELYIYLNGREFFTGTFVPKYLFSDTIESNSPSSEAKYEFSIKTKNSTLPPILNAVEIYQMKEFQQLLTNEEDVDAIVVIKAKYRVKRNWQGDPCDPNYLWQGLNCSYDDYDPPRIISLNLSSCGLVGGISPYISSLQLLQSLDLSNNSLTGTVPDFLSQLSFLTRLNLSGNKLKGSVPASLLEKIKNNQLSLSVDGNPDLCTEASCAEKNKTTFPLLVAAVVICLLFTAMAILWSIKLTKQVWKKKGLLDFKNQRFSYSDVVKITNNFERVLGKGGFGTVYLGCLEDTQVAVKMLSPSSIQGYKQFQAEVEVLMRVHHKNLTTLLGYCNEGTNMGLIYEFMANGNLQKHLLEGEEDILSWEGRLKIATEAAQGLEYLHSGCKPSIIHRDVKSTNILLNENFQPKLADFGLSRIFPPEGGSHVSTTTAGTPGYLDPEYFISNRLNEKSDVYSFGVVLLEIIACKPVIEESLERTHIIEWVSFLLAKSDIRNIVDPRLQGDFDVNSVRKALEIAMACVSSTSTKRPTMNKVVMELNECLEIEIGRTKLAVETGSKDSIELTDSRDLSAEFSTP